MALAVFFQAWGLPIFLIMILIMSWLIGGLSWLFKGSRKYKLGINSYKYGNYLVGYFLVIFVFTYSAGFAGSLSQKVLTLWDNISLINLQTPESLYDNGLLTRNVTKLGLNFMALITPLLIVYSLAYKIEESSEITFDTIAPVICKIAFGFVLMSVSIFSLWAMEHIKMLSYNLNQALLVLYFIQIVVPLFFLTIIYLRK